MQTSVISGTLIGSLALFCIACTKQLKAPPQQTVSTTVDSLIITPIPQKQCIVKSVDYFNMQGAHLHSPAMGQAIYPESEGTYSWAAFFVHDKVETFPAEVADYEEYHVDPTIPPSNGQVYLMTEPEFVFVQGDFTKGRLTGVRFHNAEILTYDGPFVQWPNLTFNYNASGQISTIDRHWPDGSQPDDSHIFKYDTQGNIIQMTTLRHGVTDESKSLFTLRFGYGAPTQHRQFYTWFQGGAFHNDGAMEIAEDLTWMNAFIPKNILTRVDRYEPHGSGASHFTDILSNHQFDADGKLIKYTDNRTSLDNPFVHVSFDAQITWYCEGGLVFRK